MEKTYRDYLIETLDYLINMRLSIFALALNLSMKNDLKEVNDVFDIGDTYTFELNHLDKGSDDNVQKVVDLIKNIQITVDSLININVIEEDELTNEI